MVACKYGGGNYWETYAPVVNWMSIRTMLVLRSLHNLHAWSADFVQAFSQPEIKVDIYLEIPLDMRSPENKGYVLKLLKNLYGLKDAGRTWWEYLQQGLENRGFQPSKVDPSVYLQNDCICLTFVDDFLIF